MKIKIIKISKPAFAEYSSLVREYHKRLSTFVKVENIVLNDEPKDLKLSPSELLICLDEHGLSKSTKDVASAVENWQQDSRIKQVNLLIGGSYGISKNLLEQAHETWTLSALTFQGDFAWLGVWEQLYRAFTIIKGLPYHHE